MSATPSTLGSALVASAIALTGLLLNAPTPREAAAPTVEVIDNDDGTTTRIEIEPGQWIPYDPPVPVERSDRPGDQS